jgi:hypothetical protein
VGSVDVAVDVGALVGAFDGVTTGGVVVSLAGRGMLAPTVDGPDDGSVDGFVDGLLLGLAAVDGCSASLSCPRVPNSTSRPATIATTAATATKEDRTWPCSP